jgi:hypothetical protein
VFSAIVFLLVYFANCIAFELLALQIGLAMGVVNTAAGDAVMQNAPMTQESQQSTYSNQAFTFTNQLKSSPAKKKVLTSNQDKSTGSKNNYSISLDFVIRLYQDEDETNPFHHGFSKEMSHALATFWQTKSYGSNRAGGGDKIWNDFDLDVGRFPEPIQQYTPDLTSEYYEKLLGTDHNVIKREAYPPEADSCLPPARPKDPSSITYGSQWIMNPMQKRVSPGQALAMIGQARYLETNKPPSAVNVLIFKQGAILQSLLVPRDVERGQTVFEAMNQAKAMNSSLFMCKSPTSVIQLNIVQEDGTKIPMVKINYKTWTISDILKIVCGCVAVTLEISEMPLGSDTSDLHSVDYS